jgi:hypothetical protein
MGVPSGLCCLASGVKCKNVFSCIYWDIACSRWSIKWQKGLPSGNSCLQDFSGLVNPKITVCSYTWCFQTVLDQCLPLWLPISLTFSCQVTRECHFAHVVSTSPPVYPWLPALKDFCHWPVADSAPAWWGSSSVYSLSTSEFNLWFLVRLPVLHLHLEVHIISSVVSLSMSWLLSSDPFLPWAASFFPVI